MNDKEIQVKKLILKFSIQYYEMENSKLFDEYCSYCVELTNKYNNKINPYNNIDLINNIHDLFRKDSKTKPRYKKPTDFLTCGFDFNDDILLEYFNYLII